MNAGGKLAVYGVTLGAVFAATFAAGRALDPIGLSNAEPVEHAGAMDGGDGLPGLASATSELTLVPSTDLVQPGRASTYSFTIEGEDGTVTDFELEHTKPMHLIVVRRDFTGFVHTHPTMAPDGTWSAELEISDPGAYRVYADFVVDGDKHTLGTDLFAPGHFQPVALPEVSPVADAGEGYEVEVSGEVIAGEESELEFTIRKDGQVLSEIPDYLGAKGHLVALRDGDLAYLHVHTEGDRLVFEADFPTAGAYRLFLQFDHGDQIRTAVFTVNAQEPTR